MKKNKRINKAKIIILSLLSVSLTSSLILTSCSSTMNKDSIKFKIIDGNTEIDNGIFLLNSLTNNDSSPKKAILGDLNINEGNYIIIYGSIAGSSSTIDFRKWLSGGGIENGGGITIDTIVNSNFLNSFIESEELNSKAKILLYIDNPIFNSDDYIFSPINYDPFSVYTKEILLNKYNYDYTVENGLTPSIDHTYEAEFDSLPKEYKNLDNKFIRKDQSAIDYRDFINYAISVRPNLTPVIGSDNKLSGAIAFSKKNKPVILSGIDNNNNAISTNETMKSIYKYYFEKEYGK